MALDREPPWLDLFAMVKFTFQVFTQVVGMMIVVLVAACCHVRN